MRNSVLTAVVGLLLPSIWQGAGAQDAYPSKPINVIVPFAAGGPTDVVTRILGEHMSRTLGQQLVVENVGGAGGTTGMSRVATAAPDGYTLGVGNMGTQSAAPALYPNLKYDPATSFAQIGIANFTPQAIVSKKDNPAKDLKELLAYLKANSYQAELWPCRRRLDLPRVRHPVQRPVRPQACTRRLSRHRSRPQRSRWRPDRLHGRPVAQRHPADQGRHHRPMPSPHPRASKACPTCRPPRRPASTSSSAPGTRWSLPRARRRSRRQTRRRPQQGPR